MNDPVSPEDAVRMPVPPWYEPFEGQLLETSGPDLAKVVALTQAIALYRHRPKTRPTTVLRWAREFEAYLSEPTSTGKEAPGPPVRP